MLPEKITLFDKIILKIELMRAFGQNLGTSIFDKFIINNVQNKLLHKITR